MRPTKLESVIYDLLISAIHGDSDSIDTVAEELKESIESITTFQESQVLSCNKGLRFSFKDGSLLHLEITY
jgi:hypothetical protein